MPLFEDDPFGKIKEEKGPVSPEPRDVNLFHSRSDVDSSQFAQHHTIGVKHDQAAAGDHIHDGTASKKIGAGLSLTVDLTSGTAEDQVDRLANMLQRVIEFDIT